MAIPENEHWAVPAPERSEVLRALLLFDRVWDTSNIFLHEQPDDMFFYNGDMDWDGWWFAQNIDLPGGPERYIRGVARRCRKYGWDVTACYPSAPQFEPTETPTSTELAYLAALNNLPIVDPESLSLDQLVEFRTDKTSVRRYRDLRLWLNHGVAAKSLGEAEDAIGQKLDDYEWAIKKHGLQTVVGTFSQVLDWKPLVAAGTAAFTGGALAGQIGIALGAGAILAARIGISVTEKLIDFEDVTRGNGREVAIIYDARKRFGQG